MVARFGIAEECGLLYEMAGIGPEDVDFVEAYDDYPVMVALELEAIGFSKPGEAVRLLREKDLTVEGDLPVNTSGGMLSLGQAGAGGGFVHVTEAIAQLTGQPLGRPVPDARIGLISCLGTANYDRGVCTAAAILKRAG